MKNNAITRSAHAEQVKMVAALGFSTIGWEPRSCDFEVVQDMCANASSQREQIAVVADYCWDHLLGESDNVTPTEIRKAIRESRGGAKLR